jgi:pre-rRNA-processing protein IPI1
VLEALLDAAPALVGANAPAATLRHLAELLRRGDDAASSSLVSGGSGFGNGGKDGAG